ncbi:MAG TPA: rod shape-determining protein MreD [Candidatus Dormibacteraeota bacterium]|nr:rod shape-determining protein MreD [Candidatus Dormibacteraeota bacterium]
MKRLIGGLLMLSAVLVQVTWASRIEVAGAFPNLVLLAVIALTWTAGVRSGLVWACVGGLLLDLTAPGPLGPHALALLAGAYVSGFWARNLTRETARFPAMAAAVSTVLYSLILVGADAWLGLPVPPFRLAIQLTAAASVYNALLMPLAVAPLRSLQARMQPKIQSSMRHRPSTA